MFGELRKLGSKQLILPHLYLVDLVSHAGRRLGADQLHLLALDADEFIIDALSLLLEASESTVLSLNELLFDGLGGIHLVEVARGTEPSLHELLLSGAREVLKELHLHVSAVARLGLVVIRMKVRITVSESLVYSFHFVVVCWVGCVFI